jgi:hypothetical protein
MTMSKLFLTRILLVAGLISCAIPKPLAPTIPEAHRSETEALPPDPETEALEGVPSGDWIEPLESGSCFDAAGKSSSLVRPCPEKSGIAMSEARAARFALFKIRYKELRTNYVSDRKVWAAQRELYETRLVLADRAIQDLQPSWLDKHKGELGLLGGTVLGVVITTAASLVLQ